MKKTKVLTQILIVILVFITIIVALFRLCILPIKNLYLEVPGIASNLANMVVVNGRKDMTKGELRLTSVGILPATPISLGVALSSPVNSVINEQSLTGNTNMQEYNKLQEYYMQTSENTAKMMALKLANKPYEMEYGGVYILSIDKNSDFKNKLKIGDLILGVNNKKFNSAEDMIKYITAGKVGDKITVQIKRDGNKKEISGKLRKIPGLGKPGIGVGLVTKTNIKSEDKIKINAGDIGGPSAGMMFTLESYELLTGKDLKKGRNIAGTGEIYPDGKIGRIGGIDKKVVGASQEGATIFLAPDDEITDKMRKLEPGIQTNYEEAKKTAEKLNLKIKVVPVKTIQDAISYLEKTN